MNTDQRIENIFWMLADIKQELALLNGSQNFHFEKIEKRISVSGEYVHKRIGKAVIQLDKSINSYDVPSKRGREIVKKIRNAKMEGKK